MSKPDENGVADQRVADGHFRELRQAAEDHQVVQIEVVAGVDAETQRVRVLRGLDVLAEHGVRRVNAALERARVRLGVELDAIRADRRRPSYRGGIGVDEDPFDALGALASSPGAIAAPGGAFADLFFVVNGTYDASFTPLALGFW